MTSSMGTSWNEPSAPLARPHPGYAKRYPHEGRNLTVREWAELLGISTQAMYQRLRFRRIRDPFRPVKAQLKTL